MKSKDINKQSNLGDTPSIKNEKSFYTSIDKAIARGQHIDALKDIIKEYGDYKSYMSGVFEKGERLYENIFRFHVDYLLKKPVWREFEIDGSQTFDDMAEGIIRSMDWDNDHLHSFMFPKTGGGEFQNFLSPYSIDSEYCDNDQYPTYHSNEIRIAEIDYKKYPKFDFMFDFGDGHQFGIKHLGNRLAKKSDNWIVFPKTIDQRGVGPEQYPRYFDEADE